MNVLEKNNVKTSPMTVLLLLLSSLHTASALAATVKNTSVVLDVGILRGFSYDFGFTKAAVYRGVPYAAAPVGMRRFKPPDPVEPWTGYKNAFEYGSACLQFMDYVMYDLYSQDSMHRQSEDCLFLNIFAPANFTKPTYPVIVWLHGGSFLAGSGDTGMDDTVIAKNFIRYDFILITINYRLGPLGFASSSSESNAGNFGLYDQVEALRWIQKRIHKFGGDKTSVTVMGESAGGASSSILALSPMTKGLISRAIVMSGSAGAIWAIGTVEDSDWDVYNIVDYLNCQKKFRLNEIKEAFSDDPKFVEFAKDLSLDCPMIQSLSNPSKQPISCHRDMGVDEAWDCLRREADFSDLRLRKIITIHLSMSKAVVDGRLVMGTAEQLFAKHPRVPVMTGVAGLEWGHKLDGYYFDNASSPTVDIHQQRDLVKNVVDTAYRRRLASDVDNSTIRLIENATMWHYIYTQKPSGSTWNTKEFISKLREIESDAEFVAPCEREASSYARAGVDAFLYSFEYFPRASVYNLECSGSLDPADGEVDCTKDANATVYEDAFHGLDHAYLFTEGYTSNQKFTYTPLDFTMAHILCGYIRNFSKYGDPTAEGSPNTWRPYDLRSPSYMRIAWPPKTVDEEFRWRGARFWNRYIPWISNYVSLRESKSRVVELQSQLTLTEKERLQFEAYRRAWWALWILVAATIFFLWTCVIYAVARRCIRTEPGGTYKNVLVRD